MALRHRHRPHRLDADDADDGRRGNRLPLIVAAIALLGLGMWIGRASQPGVEEGAEPQPAPTPAEEEPIDWPGPTDTDNGVPVGYTRTEAGAVAAAVEYTSRPRYGEEALAAIDVMAAESARDELRAVELESRERNETLGIDPDQEGFANRAIVAGYAVDSLTSDAATVRLWGIGVLVDPGHGGLPAAWATTTVSLAWERGDWRLVSRRTKDGLSPEDANTGDPRRTARAMNGFKEFWHVAR